MNGGSGDAREDASAIAPSQRQRAGRRGGADPRGPARRARGGEGTGAVSRPAPPLRLHALLRAELAEQRVAALDELPRAERFGDVVVRPDLVADLLVRVPSLRG